MFYKGEKKCIKKLFYPSPMEFFLVFSIFFILSFLASSNTDAAFQKIYKGYKYSDRVKSIETDKEIVDVDFKFGRHKYDWKLEVGKSHNNSFLQSLYSFQSEQTITDTTSFAMTKSSYKYGTFRVQHVQFDYDLSQWGASSLSSFSDDNVFEYKNSLSYSFEMLNSAKSLEWDVLLKTHESELSNNKVKRQKDYLSFFQAYNQAKLRIILDRLYKDSEKRALKNIKQVKRRVKDGLSRKFELNQAKLSLLSQEEKIIRNEAELREKVIIIEEIIGTKISKSDYKHLKWTYKNINKYTNLLKKRPYPELEDLQTKGALTQLLISKKNEESRSSLNLELSYIKNAVNSSQGDALSYSLGRGENDEKSISLSYTLPLGFQKSDSIKKKLLLQKNKNLLERRNLEGQLNAQFQALSENIKRYAKAINLLERKISIAQDSVFEYQRLYKRGQVSFEEVLRAEDNFNNAKISKVNMYSLYDLSLAKLAYLTGNIVNFLDIYTD